MPPASDHTVPSRASAPPTLATIDLSALTHNLGVVRRFLAPGCDVLAVVKADAYGHGAVAVTKSLMAQGIGRFGVATIQEGVLLREGGVTGQILILGAVLPAQFEDLLHHRLTPAIHEPEIAQALAARLGAGGAPYPVHLKIDTGMGRLGVSPEQVLPLLQAEPFRGPLRLEGLMTHLADADNVDPAYTNSQIERFQTVQAQAAAAGHRIPLTHAANSAAMVAYPSARFSLVRPGLMLYGYLSAPPRSAPVLLSPVMTLSSTVVQVRTLETGQSVSYNRAFIAARKSRIAVLPIGYADGYSRALSNRGEVLLHGKRCPVVGRVCMDMTLVDVTALAAVAPGDEAVLIGRQGGETILATDLAAGLGTIPYEILCGIGPRVPRVHR